MVNINCCSFKKYSNNLSLYIFLKTTIKNETTLLEVELTQHVRGDKV